MRLSSALVLGACLLGALCAPRPADATTIIRLRADHIAFYSDRYLIEADGNVRVETGDGATITGDAFSMDLKLNRFLIASHVHLKSPAGSLDGAAISDFLDFKRIYFVPVISKPDRWTYENGDYAHPLRGRQMPGDAFFFPDVSANKRNLSATSAVIGERSFVRFENVRAYAGDAWLPMPAYYVYFGINRYLAINSLSGANYDATWNATGGANSTTALHVRYDSANKLYLSFEQHLAGDRSYLVLSDNPATVKEHFWNLVGGDRIGSRLQVNLFTQLETTQRWFDEPSSASLLNQAYATQAFNQSFLNVSATLVNYNLVDQFSYAHPSSVEFTWTTFNHRIGKTPFYESIHFGGGFNHDSVGYDAPAPQVGMTPPPYVAGLQQQGDVNYTTIWNDLLGYTLYVPDIKLGNRDNPYKTYHLNTTLTAERDWSAGLHHINHATFIASVSRTFSREFTSSAYFDVVNTADIYNVGGYKSAVVYLPDGTPVESFLAFKGASTERISSIGTTYSASPNLVASLNYRHHDDFPIAVPGLFPPPPLNNIGQYIYEDYLGQPPDALMGELRARLLPHLTMDVQRTYYFNFGTIRWSPQFLVQFSP